MPERQRIAVSLWVSGKGYPPLSYADVGSLMGISRQNAHRLVRKGLAWMKVNGHTAADLREPAQAS